MVMAGEHPPKARFGTWGIHFRPLHCRAIRHAGAQRAVQAVAVMSLGDTRSGGNRDLSRPLPVLTVPDGQIKLSLETCMKRQTSSRWIILIVADQEQGAVIERRAGAGMRLDSINQRGESCRRRLRLE